MAFIPTLTGKVYDTFRETTRLGLIKRYESADLNKANNNLKFNNKNINSDNWIHYPTVLMNNNLIGILQSKSNKNHFMIYAKNNLGLSEDDAWKTAEFDATNDANPTYDTSDKLEEHGSGFPRQLFASNNTLFIILNHGTLVVDLNFDSDTKSFKSISSVNIANASKFPIKDEYASSFQKYSATNGLYRDHAQYYQIKQKGRYLYYANFQYINVLDTQSTNGVYEWKTVYKAPFFISGVQMFIPNSSDTSKFYFAIALEKYKYAEDISEFYINPTLGWQKITENTFNMTDSNSGQTTINGYKQYRWDHNVAHNETFLPKTYSFGGLVLYSVGDKDHLLTTNSFLDKSSLENAYINLTKLANVVPNTFDESEIRLYKKYKEYGITTPLDVWNVLGTVDDIDFKNYGSDDNINLYYLYISFFDGRVAAVNQINNMQNVDTDSFYAKDGLPNYLNENYSYSYSLILAGTNGQTIQYGDYIIARHDLNQIAIYNNYLHDREYIELPDTPLYMMANGFLLYVTMLDGSINIYKLIDMPYLEKDYQLIEKDKIDKNNNYYINTHLRLVYKGHANESNTHQYKVNLLYRKNRDSTEYTFPETGLWANMYMKLNDMDTILSELQFELDKKPVEYMVTDQNINAAVFSRDSGAWPVLYKIFAKDLYYMDGNMYFRLRFLCDKPYALRVTFEGNEDQKILIMHNLKSISNTEIPDFVDREYYFREEALKKDNHIIDRPEQYYYNDDDDLDLVHRYAWFKIPNVYFNSNPILKFELYEISYYPGFKLVQTYEMKDLTMRYADPAEVIDPMIKKDENLMPKSIKYLTNDGEIHNTEKSLLSDLEHSYVDHDVKSNGKSSAEKETLENNAKDFYLSNLLSNTAFEEVIKAKDITINKGEYIHDRVNDETEYGFYDLTHAYNSYQEKQNTLVSDVYIQGIHVPHSMFKQKDTYNGMLYNFVSVRRIKNMLKNSLISNIIDENGNFTYPNADIILVGNKNKIVETQKFIYKHTVDNTFEDQGSMIHTTGLSIPANVPRTISVDNIRVFIKKKTGNFFTVLNPTSYNMVINREYGYIRLTIPGFTNLTSGDEISFVTSGALSSLTSYIPKHKLDKNKLRNDEDYYNAHEDEIEDVINEEGYLDSLPLAQVDDSGEIYVNNITNPNDIDINFNGLTLYPNIDYYIIPASEEMNVPSLIVFSTKYPIFLIDSIEINQKNIGENYSYFWYGPAKDSTTHRDTFNIFSMDDDRLLFIPGTFSIFVNNYRIPSNSIKIINSKTIQINYMNGVPLINVLAVFNYPNHTNLQMIMDHWKYQHIDFNDKYYHTKRLIDGDNKIPDSFANGVRHFSYADLSNTDLQKLALIEKINARPKIPSDPNILRKYADLFKELVDQFNIKANQVKIKMNLIMEDINLHSTELDSDRISLPQQIEDLKNQKNQALDLYQAIITQCHTKARGYYDNIWQFKSLSDYYLSIDDTDNAQLYTKKEVDAINNYNYYMNRVYKYQALYERANIDYNDLIEQSTTMMNITIHTLEDLIAYEQNQYDDLVNKLKQMEEDLQNAEKKLSDEEMEELKYQPIANDGSHDVVIDANDDNAVQWDTYIDSKPFTNKYLTQNYFFNMNPDKFYDKKTKFNNPKI